jgi:hypothetical protein
MSKTEQELLIERLQEVGCKGRDCYDIGSQVFGGLAFNGCTLQLENRFKPMKGCLKLREKYPEYYEQYKQEQAALAKSFDEAREKSE